jgi:TnsA-like endonuclease N terminal
VVPKRSAGGVETPIVHFRRADGAVAEARWADADASVIVDGMPWRKFPWYLGQRSKAGIYWCATERRHVSYESRLELSRLVMKDFDPRAIRIASQPFRLVAKVEGTRLTRTPDFLVITSRGPLIVDVKPELELQKPNVAQVLTLTRRVVEGRGWEYELATEPPEIVYANIRFLAGYRRSWLFHPDVLTEVRAALNRNREASIDAILTETGLPRRIAFPSLMHLIWQGECTADLTRPLAATTLVTAPQ